MMNKYAEFLAKKFAGLAEEMAAGGAAAGGAAAGGAAAGGVTPPPPPKPKPVTLPTAIIGNLADAKTPPPKPTGGDASSQSILGVWG